jgi:hypothetical protein
MDPEVLRLSRLWRLRAVGLLLLVVLAGMREVPTARPRSPQRLQ